MRNSKKPTDAALGRKRAIATAGFMVATLACGLAPAVYALPPPAAPTPLPRSAASQTPSPAATGPVLPYGSPISFVLEEKVNSATTPPGTVVHMHLEKPLIVGGVTLAPAGAPAEFIVVTTSQAQSGDVDGAIQIHLDPFVLPGRAEPLPIRAFHEFLTVEMTTGQLTTRAATDQIADVFVPYHAIYHALRKGRQMVLPVGSVLRAETDATIDATHPNALVIATPPPFVSTFDAPHADLTAAPFYTPSPQRPHPLPKGKPTLPPSPPPTASPAPAASPAADASAAPQTTAPSPVPMPSR